MNVYVPGDYEAELLIGQTYVELVQSGDIDRLFVSPAPSLRSFLNIFTPPTCLLFEHDAKGIYALIYLEPSLNALFLAYWLRQDRRKSLASYRAVLKGTLAALRQKPCVLAYTGQLAVVDVADHLGYTIKCRVEDLYGPGKPGWLMQADREKIEARVRRHKGWSDDEREFLNGCSNSSR